MSCILNVISPSGTLKVSSCDDIAVTRQVQYITRKQLQSVSCGYLFGKYLGRFFAPKNLQVKLTINAVQLGGNIDLPSNDTFVMDDTGQVYKVNLDRNLKIATVETHTNVAELHIGPEWRQNAILIAFQGKIGQ